MSGKVTGSTGPFLFSNAHCWIAPSICRRLLMQAFFCAVVLALMKLGIAMAANRPIMATTIMISTNVKPPLRDVLVFIFCLSLLRREHSNKRVIIITDSVHVFLVANRSRDFNRPSVLINPKCHFFLSDLDPTALSVLDRT